jgi:V8-like Glu-specific endopeptidase
LNVTRKKAAREKTDKFRQSPGKTGRALSKKPAAKKKSRPKAGSRPQAKQKGKHSAKSAHRPVAIALDPKRGEPVSPSGHRGEILAPLKPPLHSAMAPARLPTTSPNRANLELLRSEKDVTPTHHVDAWFGSYGTQSCHALVSGAAGVSIHDLMAPLFIEDDDRVPIEQAAEYPFSAIGMLQITARNGRCYSGTGWLIDPLTVVTAGHCVFLQRDGGWARSIQVWPAGNLGQDAEPWIAKKLMSVQGWVGDGAAGNDYAAIRLNRPVDNVGSFGFRTGKTEELQRFYCHIVGFPSDKPWELWGHVRQAGEVQRDTLIYSHDTYGGNSGAPVFVVENDNVLAIGIHRCGDLSGNCATRITDRVFENLQTWKES